MEYKLEITQAADHDLRGIVRYMTEELQAPQAAERFLQQVDACYDHIRAFPAMYSPCETPALKTGDLRKAVIGNYVLVYQTEEAKQLATVLRFFYGRQDYYKDI